MTEQELQDIQTGLNRWSMISTDIAQKLLDEIYKLRHSAAMEQMHLDLVYRERDEAYTQLELFQKGK